MTSVNVYDMPINAQSGNPMRRVLVFIKGVGVAAAQVRQLTGDMAAIKDVEGQVYFTEDGKVSATACTWSTTTLTIPTLNTGVVSEVAIICTIT